MSSDRTVIADALLKMTPKERADVEDAVIESIFRKASELDAVRDPEGYRLRSDRAAAIVAALPSPLPPGAEAKVRAAAAEVARALLAER